VHRAPAQLDLLAAPVLELLAGVDARGEPRRVLEHAVVAQDVGEEVVGEDGEAVDVGEVRDPGEDEVVRGDLRPLVEARVVEERHGTGERPREGGGGPARVADPLDGAAVAEPRAELDERLGVERHQLVARVLSEHVGDHPPVHPA
jgi:hypothetical protein